MSGGVGACCAPAAPADAPGGEGTGDGERRPGAVPAACGADRPRLLPLPGGRFAMGDDRGEGFVEDGEGPSRGVVVSPFSVGATAVTNREFAAFVRATRYVTDAERRGASHVFWLQLAPAQRRDGRRAVRDLPWWVDVPDACWQRPEGPSSTVRGRDDHPVVHVSWHDAVAYCAWAGLALPTEAQWEYAARGGLEGRRLPWGDELASGGEPRCNVWRGRFPDAPSDGWTPGPVPVRSFAPNGFGLYEVSGNVWEWCADWFDPGYHRATPEHDPLQAQPTGRRAQRGGSFLCHDSYCNRYRVAARGANTPSSSSSHTGFRVVASAAT